MLEAARADSALDGTRAFVQGDATRLPLKSGAFDTVVMFGGIHHVNDRRRLFAEVARILKRGGLFVWREPADDFIVWRALRTVIYRMASSLQADTERPVRFEPTRRDLTDAGFIIDRWQTYGFLAYCFLMNSDVLAVNRLWRYVPAIRRLTRVATRIDDRTLRLPGLRRAGLIAIGTASKPAAA